IAAGAAHTCVLDDSGVQCWGSGYRELDESPIVTPALQNPSKVFAGRALTCALDDAGAQCWGRSDDLAVGTINGVLADSLNPVSIAIGSYQSCVLDDEAIKCVPTF